MSDPSPGQGSDRGRPRVGFLGLGTMGGPMCRRLVAAGYSVTAYDLDAAALAAAVDVGAVAAVSARDGALGADLCTRQLFGRVLAEHEEAERRRVRSDALLD